jgi:hypothetical protein
MHPKTPAVTIIRTRGRYCEEGFTRNSFVRDPTLATKGLNARHREIDRRAFFVSRQEITRICEFFKAVSHDSLRSLFLTGSRINEEFSLRFPVKTGSNCLR